MRSAVLFDAYPHVYAGAQKTDHLLAQGLPERGWRVTTVTPGHGAFTERLAADGLPADVVAAPPALARYGRVTTGARALRAALALPRYWVRLGRVLRRHRPEVVHVVDHRGLLLAGWPARRSGARVVWHVQALDRTRWINRFGARLADAVVVPSWAVVEKLTGLDGAAVHRIPNVDTAGPGPEPGPLARGATLVTSARLHPDKGLDVLIDALALVQRSRPDARLVVLGAPQDGFEHLPAELEARAGRAGVATAVELRGFVDEPRAVVGQARCYVQPARERTEVLPLAIVEAMAAGAPVVATDVGGVADVVQPGTTGLLVAPEDPAALAAAILEVLDDDELADRLRAAARALVEGPEHRPEGLLDAFAAVYAGAPAPARTSRPRP